MSTVQARTVQLPNHIGGRWKNLAASEFLKVVNPATHELLAEVPVQPGARGGGSSRSREPPPFRSGAARRRKIASSISSS